MLKQGVISLTEKDAIAREATLTGQEILEALQFPVSQEEKVTEIYIYSLFESYKKSVNSKIKTKDKPPKCVKKVTQGINFWDLFRSKK